ncbi:MAG TPA: iron-containing redox enzyme family protein, partial [Vicinamibacterales bacterium]|nr:iron-containing redox enzyme family protein [Vicinamibacterales bacterium]
TCTREEIRSFALHLALSTRSFNRSLFAILGVCDDLRAIRALLTNVLEEEGVMSYAPGAGATFDPERRHPAIARRFALAAGVTNDELDAMNVTPPRWFRDALAAGNWLGPYAFVAVGTEANIPPTFRLLIPALREHYGFSDDDLEFFIEHVTVDDRHAMDGARAIETIAVTEESRRQALVGARHGAMSWWQMLAKHVESRPSASAA